MTIDLTDTPEQTIKVGIEPVEVVGVLSMQNISPANVYWSSLPFGENNRGGIILPYDEIIFSGSTTIYLRKSENEVSEGEIHVRSVIL